MPAPGRADDQQAAEAPMLAWHPEQLVPTDRPLMNRLLPACWTLIGDLPGLHGSLRAIAWATSIRKRLLADLLVECLRTARMVHATMRLDPTYQPSIAEADWAARATRTWLPVLTREDAGWWIDRRGWWVADLLHPAAEDPDPAGGLISERRAHATAAHLLRLDEQRELDPAEAIEITVAGWIDTPTETGAAVRTKVRLGITPAGTLHQPWGRGYLRKPVDVDWSGCMSLRAGRFVPLRQEVERLGIPW